MVFWDLSRLYSSLLFSNILIAPYAMLILIAYGTYLYKRHENHKEKEKIRYKAMMKARGVNIIELTPDVYFFENRNYNSVYNQFQNLGFKNIKLIPLGDLSLFTIFNEGKVVEVTINAKPLSDGMYTEDDCVTIKYHSR